MSALEADELRLSYGDVDAVKGVSLRVQTGRTLGLVGESGCGKSSVAKMLTGLVAPDSGQVRLDGQPVGRDRRAVQLVPQDPYGSLNPRRRIGSVLIELLRAHGLAEDRPRARARAKELVALVGLPEAALDRQPAAFSGGQRQRLAIARALAVEPRFVVADEPVSALDVSVQATILELFADLRERLGVGMLLISHNLAVVRELADEVAVMYLGQIVESGPRAALFADPRHPYTRALLDAAPRLRGDPVAASAGPRERAEELGAGCPFAPRCARAEDRCRREAPALCEVDATRRSACHFRQETMP